MARQSGAGNCRGTVKHRNESYCKGDAWKHVEKQGHWTEQQCGGIAQRSVAKAMLRQAMTSGAMQSMEQQSSGMAAIRSATREKYPQSKTKTITTRLKCAGATRKERNPFPFLVLMIQADFMWMKYNFGPPVCGGGHFEEGQQVENEV